jgi:hypothetical protein
MVHASRMTFKRTAAAAAVLGAMAAIPAPAGAHISPCHLTHSCPSDHATYRWHGLLCVKPSASENDGTFTRRVTFRDRAYRCKR